MADRRINMDKIGRMMMIGWIMSRVELKLIGCELEELKSEGIRE